MSALRTKPLVTTHKGRRPKTEHYCVACHRDLKWGQPAVLIHCINGGFTVLHPGDEHLYTEDGGEMGYHPLGMDCAKRLGLEWTHAWDQATNRIGGAA